MNILFIPHVPNLTVINRVYEFAKNTNSYFLTWQINNASLKYKILSQINSLRFKTDNKTIQIPLLFKPEQIAVKFNTYQLNRLIDRLNIEVVVNANALLFDIKNIKVPVIYDLVDDHLEVNPDIGLNKKRIKKIKEDISNSKGVICVTEFVEKKAKILNNNTITIENGVYVERFKNAKSIKKELGIFDKKVFGFIGGIEEWTGLGEAIENYLKIKDKNTAFLVVGGNDGEYYQNLVKTYSQDIYFVGKVSPNEVAKYFKSIDIGLIPFRLNDFTHNALPIKALEYALGGASVISTKLAYLMYKKYPFVEFCDIDNFYKAMKAQKSDYKFDFDTIDWRYQSQKVLNFIKENIDE